MSLRECVLCDTTLDDGSKNSVVKEKQLASNTEASRKRNDGKLVLFKRSTSLEVHEKCRKHYVTQSSIDAYVKRSKKMQTNLSYVHQTYQILFSKLTAFCVLKKYPRIMQRSREKLDPTSAILYIL